VSEDAQPTIVRKRAYTPPVHTSVTLPWHERHRAALIGLVLAGFVGSFVWFIFSARSVRIELIPADATVDIQGGFDFELGGTWILRDGNYTLVANAAGYETLSAPLTIGPDHEQSYRYVLVPKPGLIDVDSEPVGAEVFVDGDSIGPTPLAGASIPAGTHTLELRHPRYQTYQQPLEVEGKEIRQQITVQLLPNWAAVEIDSVPQGATIFVDEVESGATPARVEIVAGTRELRLKRPGFKSWRTRIEVESEVDQVLPPARLEPADALLSVESSPSGVSVTVDGRYQGVTPIEINLAPRRDHRVRLAKAGYETANRNINLGAAEERSLSVVLAPLIGTVVVNTVPADAEIIVDGQSRSDEARTLRLPARPHVIEVRKAGYQSYRKEITPQPSLTQELAVKLLTLAEARLAAMKPRITHPAGGELVLLDGGKVQMGASRREPGRRANEVLREATITRLFYLATTEVTNGQFRKFAAGHTSGKFEEQELDKDDQPVVEVTWEEAALFCNWLSEQAKLPRFYRVEYGKVVGFEPRATGYRLPTEAEWEWAARTAPGRTTSQRFPWGDEFPPPDRHGNYADRSAAHLVGRIIFGYNDNYIVSAPAATFAADPRGLYDLSGNVAEWVNDYYEIPSADPTTDPMGPASGEFHVIRGSSWMHGTITDLRGAFRDYGVDGRADLGFRVARFAE